MLFFIGSFIKIYPLIIHFLFQKTSNVHHQFSSTRKTLRTFVAGTTSAFVGRQRASEVHHLAVGQKAELRHLDAWDLMKIHGKTEVFWGQNMWFIVFDGHPK